MITADPGRRRSVLEEVQAILAREAPPEDRDLLLSLAPVVYADMPDAMALGLSPDAVAARIREYFRFVVRTMPPGAPALPGPPRDPRGRTEPDGGEARTTGSTHGGQYEISVIETHTPDAPFIFESLKNFLLREGVRVFSAIHSIFSVKRQWERITSVGGPHEDGSKELLCHFRVERIEQKDRLRRIEHQIHSLLRSVFLAVEDFEEMTRFLREQKGRLRDRRGRPGGEVAAREFLDWLVDENYVLMGVLRFRRGPDGFEPDYDSALGALREPALLNVVFPGVMDEEQRHLAIQDDDDRIIDIDFRNNASAIHHLEPVDDIVVREWGADGRLEAATLLLGRLAKSAFTAKAESIPLLREKLAWLLENCGEAKNSHVYRATRAFYNHFPKRELFYSDAASLKGIIDRLIHISSDDEIVTAVRQGPAYSSVRIGFSQGRWSSKTANDLEGSARAAVRPGLVQLHGRLRRHHARRPLLRRRQPRAPPGGGPHPGAHGGRHLHLGGPGGARARARLRGARGAAALQALRAAGEPQRALPRADAPCRGPGRRAALRGARGAARAGARARLRREGRPEGHLAAARGSHRDAADDPEPRAHGGRGDEDPAPPARREARVDGASPDRGGRRDDLGDPPAAGRGSATLSGRSTRSGRRTIPSTRWS